MRDCLDQIVHRRQRLLARWRHRRQTALRPLRCASLTIESNSMQSDNAAAQLPHSHAVLGVSFHESLFRTLATYDASGSIRLLEWYDTSEKAGGRAYTMVDPKQLASTFASAYATRDEARTGLGRRGMAEWKSEDVNMCVRSSIDSVRPSPLSCEHRFGAVMGTRWLIWDMRRAGGGKPAATGEAFFEGADCFRCVVSGSLAGAHGSGRYIDGVRQTIDYSPSPAVHPKRNLR